MSKLSTILETYKRNNTVKMKTLNKINKYNVKASY